MSTCSVIRAQRVIVNLQPPPPYQMRIEDMWKLYIINNGPQTEVYLHGTVIEQQAGLIVDLATSLFTLPRGLKRVRANDVGTVSINQKNSNYQSVIDRLSALPNGSYEICVEVIDAATNNVLGTGCIVHEVLGLSQIVLIYPEDQSIIYSAGSGLNVRPTRDKLKGETDDETTGITSWEKTGEGLSDTWQNAYEMTNFIFSWLPPVPVPRNVIITYRIKIVELYDLQSAYDAMQSNTLFYSASGIYTTTYVYPVSAREFNSNRTYAWQVEAYADGTLLTSSEIYTFSFNPTLQRKPVSVIVKDRAGQEAAVQDIKQFNNNKDYLSITKSPNINFNILPEGLRSTGSEPSLQKSISLKREIPLDIGNLFNVQNSLGNLFANSDTKALAISFDAELFGETANRKGTGSDRKPTYGNLRLSPSLSFYGIPFGLNVLLSSENSSHLQNINSVSFFYDLDAAKEVVQNRIEAEGEENVPGLMKFFSYFNSFGIGTNYPVYTPLTLQGVPVSGLSFEFNPGWFYLATALRKNQKPIDNVSFRRDLYAGRIGIGQKSGSHLYFTGVYIKDISSSIKLDSLSRLSPSTNYVFGIDSRLNLIEDKLVISGEVATALLTRDNRDPDLVNEDIPKFVRNIFQPKISSQIDYSYSLKIIFNNSESYTKITAGVKMIGPGYRTLGNPTLRNDRFEVEGKIDQKFIRRQVSVTASIKYNHDNLINSKLFTTTTLTPAIQLGFRFKNYPYLNLGYNPNFLSNDSKDPARKIDFKNHLLTASTGYDFKLNNEMTLVSNISYLFNESKSLDSLSGYTLNSVSTTQNLLFKSPIILGFGFGMNFMKFVGASNTITNLDGNIGYTFFGNWSNVLGVSYSVEKGISDKIGLYLNSTYNFSEKISADLRIEKNNSSDIITSTNNYDEIIARTTIKIKI